MGYYKFKPESILEFYCPGLIGEVQTGTNAKTYFNNYLTLTGITADDNGYLDASQFMVQYKSTSATYRGLLTQLNDKYKEGDLNFYNGYMYDDYSNFFYSYLGYIVLPFKNKGENVKLILPGTMIHFANQLTNISSSGSGTITRSVTGFSIKKPDGTTTTIPNTWFYGNVTPLYLAVIVQGAGGGGSSSEQLVAGRGGGGGGLTAGIISFANQSTYNFTVGAGGRGGYHTEGTDSGTSTNHDGGTGAGTRIYHPTTNATLLQGGGGAKGVAQGTTRATGGTNTTNPTCKVFYYVSGSQTFANYSGTAGGSGSVDTKTTGSSVTSRILATTLNISPFDSVTYGSEATRSPGTSYSPGGAGGGASYHANGAVGGNTAAIGSSGSDGYGNGGGGGGYHVGMWIDGGKGGNGSIRFYC